MTNDTEQLQRIASIVLSELIDYIEQSRKGKSAVLKQQSVKALSEELRLVHWIREGGIDESAIREFLLTYFENSQHMHHPHYIGHQVAVPHLAAGLADMLHGWVNNPMAIYEMGPANATMEKVVINWLLEKIGWFKGKQLSESDDAKIGGGGVLTHGGSLANLTAMLAARAHIAPSVWTDGIEEPLYVLAPATSHYSIARAISIMGMGAKQLIPIELDTLERIIPKNLDRQLERMLQENRKVMAVVANACATSTGLYDPLNEIGNICEKYGVWFHVDGAHGAGALLSKKYRQLMTGASRANSMIWDGHKMMRTSALSAAVLFRDYRDLDRTFRQEGDYIVFDKEKIGVDFMHNTVECTKAALGTKFFWPLAAEGEKGMAKYIDAQYDKTFRFFELIESQPDFTCPYRPESNILCFRYEGKDTSDAYQLKLRNQLVKDGKFYITTTTIHKKRFLRLTVMNPDTEISHIENLLDEIRSVDV